MWFRKTKPASPLTEELIERVWDVQGRLKQLESGMDERLEELSKRYRRAEQSEKRFEDKKASTPCDDAAEASKVHPALRARVKRREGLNNRLKENA